MKKILCYRWKAYNYPDVIEAFRANGYEVSQISQKLLSYEVNDAFAEKLRALIRSGEYEFVFSINFFPVISDLCEEEGILYVSYSCDAPLISMYHQSVFNSVNRIFLFDVDSVGRFRAFGAENIEYLPLGVDTKRLSRQLSYPSPFDDSLTELLSDSISFVGSLYEKNSYDRIRKDLPPYLQGFFDCAITAQAMRFGSENLLDDLITDQTAEKITDILPFEKSDRSFATLPFVFETTSLGFKAASVQRKTELKQLSIGQSVLIYTESDTSDMISVTNMGGVDYRVIMPWVFKESAVNTNFTIPNIRTGISLRVWDVLGAGGFLLTNHQKEMDYYFRDGENIAWFDSEEELIDKASYYLSHEKERKSIAKKGLLAVKNGHSFKDRIALLLSRL